MQQAQQHSKLMFSLNACEVFGAHLKPDGAQPEGELRRTLLNAKRAQNVLFLFPNLAPGSSITGIASPATPVVIR